MATCIKPTDMLELYVIKIFEIKTALSYEHVLTDYFKILLQPLSVT